MYKRQDLEQLKQYAWPGNVRELRNLIERVVALSRGEELDFTRRVNDSDLASVVPATPVQYDLPFKHAKALMVDAFEREYLAHLLQSHKGNLSAASRAADLDRKHLRELLRKHGLRDPES